MSLTSRLLTATAVVATMAGSHAWSAANQSILVSARSELAPKVLQFVNAISALDNEETLPRWSGPVCPRVTGLPREEGEFLLGRLTEIARAADVPLGDESCRPNLFVFVTTKPETLLKGMQDRGVMGPGTASTGLIDTFIATPRPVRVWYTSATTTAEGQLGGGGQPSTNELRDQTSTNQPTYNVMNQSTHLFFNTVSVFTYVYVIVDQTKLKGVSRGQLADYVGMVGLAKLKPDARLGDDPTILKLFEGSASTAQPGLSSWDQAYLKSLYGTEQKMKNQRGLIADNMVREIAH